MRDRGVKFPISQVPASRASDGTFWTPERSNDDQFQGIDRFKHAEIQFLPKQNDRLTIKQSFEISFPALPPAPHLTSAFECWRKNVNWRKVFEDPACFEECRVL